MVTVSLWYLMGAVWVFRVFMGCLIGLGLGVVVSRDERKVVGKRW